ncbi:uncharacterized protein PHACADRAFT_203223 [Phanerochaete carnosa HHB-10118-sp]|uniref:Uncharacterized protein n=1 Tax=Phanerochaete carnosa (strain HHB-10118-sp) TaxID=650164 RepID=K5VNE2_PHACS|nr:uncharacterized protein PHACADRAFT_203223 [Phanerochaete carnosa HHB-10118-sp]EKM48119.1 hypothetical protein PHACADRAFT_203223 [Phanerochaete carnosa HHB-10118-sp]
MDCSQTLSTPCSSRRIRQASWVDPASGKKHRGAFRIDVELAGPWTILFRRWEERDAVNSDGSGFGDSFERASSRDALGHEQGILAGHHQIIAYDLSGIKIVLRYEVDAYRISEQPSIDTLTDQLSPLNVGSGTSGTEQKVFELVDVRHIGFAVPQPLLVKIKSRSQLSKGRFHLKDAYLQLYLGQIPALCLGIHNGNGVFTSIDEIRLDSERCSAAKEKVQPGLRKLRRLLEQIQSAVIERGQGAKLSLICQGGKLLLMQREPGDSFLPPTILKRFTSQVIQNQIYI